MVDYRRIGSMEIHSGNAASPNLLHHSFRDLWKSPRGAVLRIEFLAISAIIISFFLAAFGSCRRWSNRWIEQKGFFVAQALSLSLGTYSIGLMQSSSVKSEMYPIWTMSLFNLLSCIDPVTTYNGLNYKGPLSKVVFGIFLYCGYVLLMSISTISSVVGNMAICMLSAITFIKGFHSSLALVQQSRMRNMVQNSESTCAEATVFMSKGISDKIDMTYMTIEIPTGISSDQVFKSEIDKAVRDHKDELLSCHDACLAFGLSHRLQRHFLGLDCHRRPRPNALKWIDYKWALKLIEIELAFLYEVFFTGNPFLHYYQAKTASLWSLASFIGICFVGVAAAIPGTLSSHGSGGSTSTTREKIVDTTTADHVITFGILVSLALLHLMHLIRSWTSNWARVAVACTYAIEPKRCERVGCVTPHWRTWWLRVKAFVATRTNWFDKYLWQNKMGQYSVLPEGILTAVNIGEVSKLTLKEWRRSRRSRRSRLLVGYLYRNCARLVEVLGLDYVWVVLWDLLGSDTTSRRPAIRLDDDIKASIIHFLDQIRTDRLEGNWRLSFSNHPTTDFRPYYVGPLLENTESPGYSYMRGREESYMWGLEETESHGHRYTSCVMMWHIATWYCELVEHERQGTGAAAGSNQNRRVANALSNYCVYLVVSAPELLPGPAPETNRAYTAFAESAKEALFPDVSGLTRAQPVDIELTATATLFPDDSKEILLRAMSDPEIWTHLVSAGKQNWDDFQALGKGPRRFLEAWDYCVRHNSPPSLYPVFWDAVGLAKLLLGDDPPLRSTTRRSDELWKTLADVWVRLLVYAAPYGNAEAHMRHLAQGGEFTTHLWALLYHLDVREWKVQTNLAFIATKEDAHRVLSEDGQAVLAYLKDEYDSLIDEVATASRLEDGVRYYYTLDSEVAELFRITSDQRLPALVLLKKEANNQNCTFYDGEFNAYDIARFVTANKIALAHDQERAQGSPSNSANQSLEDDGGRSEDGIDEEL